MAYKVAIDPGHRRDTGGKRWEGFLEYEFNEDVAQRLKKHLEYNGFQTKMTITTPDHPYPESTAEGRSKNLRFRADTANAWGADILVSIHANAFEKDLNAGGYETFAYKTGTKAHKLATAIHNRSKQYLGTGDTVRDRGVKTANFAVLTRSKMPATLIEHAFYTNAKERAMMMTDDYRERAAIHIAHGICDYFGVGFAPKPKPAPAPDPKPSPKPNTRTLYKVQVGAYAVKSNAEALLKELQGKGYKPFIVQVEEVVK